MQQTLHGGKTDDYRQANEQKPDDLIPKGVCGFDDRRDDVFQERAGMPNCSTLPHTTS
jgi:hypothetical protein